MEADESNARTRSHSIDRLAKRPERKASNDGLDVMQNELREDSQLPAEEEAQGESKEKKSDNLMARLHASGVIRPGNLDDPDSPAKDEAKPKRGLLRGGLKKVKSVGKLVTDVQRKLTNEDKRGLLGEAEESAFDNTELVSQDPAPLVKSEPKRMMRRNKSSDNSTMPKLVNEDPRVLRRAKSNDSIPEPGTPASSSKGSVPSKERASRRVVRRGKSEEDVIKSNLPPPSLAGDHHMRKKSSGNKVGAMIKSVKDNNKINKVSKFGSLAEDIGDWDSDSD